MSDVPPSVLRAQMRQWAAPVKGRLMALHAVGLCEGLFAALFALGLARTLLAFLTPGASVVWPLFWLAAGLIGRAGVGFVTGREHLMAARRIIRTLRQSLIAKALNGPALSGAQAAKVGAIFEPTEALEGYYARFVPARFQASVAPLIAIIVIAFASPFSALILLFTLVPFVTLMALSGMATASVSKRQFEALSRLSGLFADRLQALPLILAFDNAPAQVRAVAKAAHEVSERTLNVLRLAFMGSAVLEFFSALSVALIAVYCGFSLLGLLPFPVPSWLGFRGQSAFEAAFFVLAFSPEVYAPLRRLSAAYHEQQTAEAAVVPLMALEVTLSAPDRQAVHLTSAPRIEVTNLSARFADDPDAVIGPISFTAEPGQVVALAGASGSGKSTLLKRLIGISPDHGLGFDGKVSIDGTLLTPDADLTPSLGWVSQHTPLLAGTLRTNLTLSHPEATDEAIAGVLTATGLTAVVAARGGLEAVIDERGSGLSGGERRRIGLARALLKPAPLLLLDEPTSDLDVETEMAMLEALKDAFAGRTVIVATHSDTVMALADEVVRL